MESLGLTDSTSCPAANAHIFLSSFCPRLLLPVNSVVLSRSARRQAPLKIGNAMTMLHQPRSLCSESTTVSAGLGARMRGGGFRCCVSLEKAIYSEDVDRWETQRLLGKILQAPRGPDFATQHVAPYHKCPCLVLNLSRRVCQSSTLIQSVCFRCRVFLFNAHSVLHEQKLVVIWKLVFTICQQK